MAATRWQMGATWALVTGGGSNPQVFRSVDGTGPSRRMSGAAYWVRRLRYNAPGNQLYYGDNLDVLRWPIAVLVGALLSWLVSIGPGSAQTTAKPAGAASPTPVAAYATRPFDIAVDTLPPGYRGVECTPAAAALRRMRSTKDQYETSAAYIDRLRRLAATPILGAVKVGDVLAFKVSSAIERRYDADTGILTVRSLPDTVQAGAASASFTAWTVTTPKLAKSSYVGSNPFGVKVPITRISGATCGVIYSGSDDFSEQRFAVGVAEAKALENSLGMLLIGTLLEPYVLDGMMAAPPPTLTQPVERLVSIAGIQLRVEHAWYYNVQSGKILSKSQLVQSGPISLRPVRVSMSPAIMLAVQPNYPADARASGIRGIVVVDITIGPDGRVTDVLVLKSVPELDRAAVAAVRQWRYSPPLVNGRPAYVIVTEEIRFEGPAN